MSLMTRLCRGSSFAQRMAGCDVAVDSDGELPVKPVDAAWSKTAFQLGDRVQPDQALLRRGNQQAAECCRIVPLSGQQAHRHRVLLRSFLERGDLIFARHQQPNRAGDVGHANAEVRRELAVDVDLQLRIVQVQVRLDVCERWLLHHPDARFLSGFDQRSHVRAQQLSANRRERFAPAERVRERDSRTCDAQSRAARLEPSAPSPECRRARSCGFSSTVMKHIVTRCHMWR